VKKILPKVLEKKRSPVLIVPSKRMTYRIVEQFPVTGSELNQKKIWKY
jgi:hypothetical protein